ncbi:MAG: Uma2 family endonuclease [Desulfamplus sp.]|nr:Uma2 family endonuclease [Desulfamplus sp.]
MYEKHCVKEYWIINPDAEYIMVYRLDGVKYGKPDYLIKSDTLISCVVEGLVVDLAELWV